MKALLLLLLFLLSVSCTRKRPEVRDPQLAMRPAPTPTLFDDLEVEGFLAGVRNQLKYLERSFPTPLVFGGTTISSQEYATALRNLLSYAETRNSWKALLGYLDAHFVFHEVYGRSAWGEIFLTSYYEPVLEGALLPTDRFTEPLLKKPEDLIHIEVEQFDDRFQEIRTMRGRMLKDKAFNGALRVGPYYSRKEIAEGKLDRKKLALAWVNPIDAFFLQVQGSGTIKLPDGKQIRLGYHDQNGFPYEPIGKFLKEVIPLEKMTLKTIESYLRTLPHPQLQEILNKNPSYVFFTELKDAAMTTIQVPCTDGRTLATDSKLFPKGSLAFLTFEKPVFEDPNVEEPSRWEKTSRFVLDQDTGGAIRGAGRADSFWGRGREAGLFAGHIKQKARLYYLVPK